MEVTIIRRLPTVEEYTALRHSVGWPVFDDDAVRLALSNTLFAAVAMNESGVAIGMGRVLGDDVVYFHIQDVIVTPEQQGKGVGKGIMAALMSYIDERCVSHSNIGLMCSRGREPFYKELGFIERPSEKFGAGMIIVVP